MSHTSGNCQSMGGSSSCSRALLTAENGLLPKNLLADSGEGFGRVDVGRLDELRPEPRRDLVEAALAGAARVDWARERDDADDLGACRRGRLEAVAADRVEADPDGAHGRRFYGAEVSRPG